ncbi:phosphatidylglycerophosphatase A family protein [Bacillus sp. Brlt_9]|uniref:phosphatidylglycerophosphatase A family protein n=1 Tax=Bacillus sp. Brlt_9 TaxID=3110916 RepID=UPI003F7B8BD9
MKKNEDLFQAAKEALEGRGVDLNELAILVYDAQKKHSAELTIEIALEHIEAVLKKREVQHAVLTGIAIDIASEKGLLEGPIQDIIARDEGLYGPDETLAFSITNCYGSIASSNFGNFDINKPGIIGHFNDKEARPGEVHTFLDDILCALVAAACSRYAHQNG